MAHWMEMFPECFLADLLGNCSLGYERKPFMGGGKLCVLGGRTH